MGSHPPRGSAHRGAPPRACALQALCVTPAMAGSTSEELTSFLFLFFFFFHCSVKLVILFFGDFFFLHFVFCLFFGFSISINRI